MRAVPLVVAIAAIPTTAAANPMALPYTYNTETLSPGQVEIEEFADLTPVRAASEATGLRTAYLASQFQTEIEIGIAPRLELGLYFTYVPVPSNSLTDTAIMPEGNGIKERLRYTFADPGSWPIDVGVYGELTEGDREFELEGKILLQRRIGKLRIATNLWAEYEFEYANGARDVVLNPTLGATYEVTPSFHAGIDSWLRGEWPHPAPASRPFALGPEYYVGPALMYNFGKIWWSVGFYLRATDTDHFLEPGDPYGKWWLRSMIGYNL